MSAKTDSIPRATIQRLSVYLQELESFERDDIRVVSSEQLAKACHLNATQIRKDLTYFGEFGVRGVGYDVKGLIGSISQALSIDRPWKAALIGVGNLGKALLRYQEFRRRRFLIVGAFDLSPSIIGTVVGDITVLPYDSLKNAIGRLGVELGIITTPASHAQRVAEELCQAGVKGILSFAPTRLVLPGNVFVEYVDFFNHLYSLAFHVSESKQGRS